ncbi:spermatogenesis-associated protein 22 isoform X2 [Osmerus eperlanus]|uniref:spermatogenesis-associated protein 22 isoform X2 n=1 Tax=Osmerus eperlanus TaxID=29151 RepID=UPI002E0DCA31
MKRYENQTRPTAGCLSVPLFNQKKRSRLPLTSNPTENEFFPSNEYMPSQGPASSNTSYTRHAQNQAHHAPAVQNSQWNRPDNPQPHQLSQVHCSRPAPGPMGRGCAPLPHPYKPANTGYSSSQTAQQNITASQDFRVPSNPRQSSHANPRGGGHAHSIPAPATGYSHRGQPSAHTQATPPRPLQPHQAPTPPPSRPVPAPQTSDHQTWRVKTTSSAGPLRQPAGNNNIYNTKPASQTQVKPVAESSLRILTAVIAGMRHWSQFKDKAPALFEIYATLDSAVTVGSLGAKNFLMRDGKEVLRCVFYENELELPRLIRGQVHRCVGNYDSGRDVLTCVSVRAALPSEQRNAREAVRASDAEMRGLVKSLSEV